MKKLICFLLLVSMQLFSMEESAHKINLPLFYIECPVTYDHNLWDQRILLSAENIQSVPEFQMIFNAFGTQIIENTSPALGRLVKNFPHDPQMGIVIRYAQAVTMRLSLLAAEHRQNNIEWARMRTPADARELDYIYEGVPSPAICGKVIWIQGDQKDLAEKFRTLLQKFNSK